jgi:hypothetical protein
MSGSKGILEGLQAVKKFSESSGLGNNKDNVYGSIESNDQHTDKGNTQDGNNDNKQSSKQSNNKGTTQHTNNVTNKYTIGKPDKSELFNGRLVSNVTRSQKKYVKETAKKFENESAFIRFMIDYFMENIEIK